MNKEILRQIEAEMLYAKIKYPKHTLDLAEARFAARKKISDETIYICSNVKHIVKCDSSHQQICSIFAAITILVRSLDKMYCDNEKIFQKRDNHLINLLIDLKKQEEEL